MKIKVIITILALTGMIVVGQDHPAETEQPAAGGQSSGEAQPNIPMIPAANTVSDANSSTQPSSSRTTGETGQVSAGGGVIGPDDAVTIVVLNSEELSKTWRVGTTGDLNLPLVGTVHAAGMTAQQFQGELITRLRKYIREPQVTAYISEFRSQPVTVAGAVTRPGTIQRAGPKTLLELLMMAGGPTNAGSVVTITRSLVHGPIPLPGAHTDAERRYSSVELPLKAVMEASSPASNLAIMPEDVITVVPVQKLVYVIGEVNRPGAVELVTKDSVSLMEVIAAAGGTTKMAAAGKAAVLRLSKGGTYTRVASVNVGQVVSGKTEDIKLTAGDVLVLPTSGWKVYVQAASLATITAASTILTRF